MVRLASNDDPAQGRQPDPSRTGQWLHRCAEPGLDRAALAAGDRRQPDVARTRPAGRRALPDGSGPEGSGREAQRALSSTRSAPCCARTRFAYTSVNRNAAGIQVQLKRAEDLSRARNQIASNAPELLLATDAAKPNALLATIPAELIKKFTDDAVEQNITTLRNRINALGVAEPVIQRQGSGRIVVQMPGVQDTARGQEADRRDGDAGIPRRRGRQCGRGPGFGFDSARGPAVFHARPGPGRQARADPAVQAHHRHRRPVGQRRRLARQPERTRPRSASS